MRYSSSLALLVLVFLSPVPLLACIQGKHIDDALRPPKKIDLASAFPSRVDLKIAGDGDTSAAKPTPEERAEHLSRQIVSAYGQKPPAAVTAEDTNDYAASLIYLKRPAEAIPVLVALEKKAPGLYATAANLGTAYELVGDLPPALTWIKEGVARIPQSHDGTEWLHLAILVTRMKLQADPSWLEKHSVLDAVGPKTAEDTVRAISYQLNERLHFVSPPGPVVCDLFYQAALHLKRPAMQGRRKNYLQESLRFGELRKVSIEQINSLGTIRN